VSPRRRELDLRRAAEALADERDPALTMAAVARRVGVAKPTLYRLARSRAELIQACIDAEAERLLDQLYAAFGRGGGDGRLAVVLDAFGRFRDDSPGGLRLLFGGRHPEARAAVRRVEDRVNDLLRREARAAGDDPPPASTASALIGAAAAVTLRALEDRAPVEAPRL
jgi:AcrR family transcriptional regulator